MRVNETGQERAAAVIHDRQADMRIDAHAYGPFEAHPAVLLWRVGYWDRVMRVAVIQPASRLREDHGRHVQHSHARNAQRGKRHHGRPGGAACVQRGQRLG